MTYMLLTSQSTKFSNVKMEPKIPGSTVYGELKVLSFGNNMTVVGFKPKPTHCEVFVVFLHKSGAFKKFLT